MQQHAGKEEGTSAAFGYNTWTSVERVWVWQKMIFSYQPLTGLLPYRPAKSDPLMPCHAVCFFSFFLFFWWKNEKSPSLDPVLWGLKQIACKKNPHFSFFHHFRSFIISQLPQMLTSNSQGRKTHFSSAKNCNQVFYTHSKSPDLETKFACYSLTNCDAV